MLQNNVGQHISKNTYLIQSHHFLSLRDLPLYADINTEYASTIFSQYFQHQRKIYSAEKEKKIQWLKSNWQLNIKIKCIRWKVKEQIIGRGHKRYITWSVGIELMKYSSSLKLFAFLLEPRTTNMQDIMFSIRKESDCDHQNIYFIAKWTVAILYILENADLFSPFHLK